MVGEGEDMTEEGSERANQREETWTRVWCTGADNEPKPATTPGDAANVTPNFLPIAGGTVQGIGFAPVH